MAGAIRRIKKQMAKRVAFTDTKIVFNGLRLFLASDVPKPNTAKLFAEYMGFLTSRANQVNMGDLMVAHFKVLSKMESGEDFLVN